jgi:hypothetical protein
MRFTTKSDRKLITTLPALLEDLESRILLSTTIAENPKGTLGLGNAGTAFSIRFADMGTLTGAVAAISFTINPNPATGKLTLSNGTTSFSVGKNTLMTAGDTLLWTPAVDATNKAVTAFTALGSDGTSSGATTTSIVAFINPTISESVITPVAWESTPAKHPGTIRVTRTGGNLTQSLDVTLNFSGSATIGTNYLVTSATGSSTATPLTVTIPANKSFIDVTVTAKEDNTADGTLTVIATVGTSSSYGSLPATNSATVSIADSNPTISIMPVGSSVHEGNTASQKIFLVTRTAAPGGTLGNPTTVNLSYTSSNFTLSNATFNNPTTVTFGKNVSQQYITVVTASDGLAKANQTLVATIGPATSTANEYNVANLTSASIGVVDNSPTVSLTTVANQAWEGAATTGTHQGVIQVWRTAGNYTGSLDVTLNVIASSTNSYFSLVNDGKPLLYNGTTSQVTVTIPMNQRFTTVNVNSVDDGIADPTLTVQLTVASDPLYFPAAGAAGTGKVSVIDKNPTVTVSAVASGITEGGTNQKAFIITRTAGLGGNLSQAGTVTLSFTIGSSGLSGGGGGGGGNTTTSFTGPGFSLVNLIGSNFTATGTPMAFADTATTGSLTLTVAFSANQATQPIFLTTSDDGVGLSSSSATQTIIGTLVTSGTSNGAPTGSAVVLANTTSTVKVADASPVVSLVIVSGTASEQRLATPVAGVPPRALGEFVVKRTGNTTQPLTIPFSFGNSSSNAVFGTQFILTDSGGSPLKDYLGNLVSNTMQFIIPPGFSQIPVFVKAIDDLMNDSISAVVSLAGTANIYTVGSPSSASISITNFNRAPTVRTALLPKFVGLNKSVTLTFSNMQQQMGAALNKDSKGTLQLSITALNSGTLQVIKAGTTTATTAAAGTVLSAGDQLIWTPATNFFGTANGFTVSAVDGTVTSATTTDFVMTVV